MAFTQVGMFAWQLALALLPMWAWLIVCNLLPRLRVMVGFSFCVAALWILASCLLSRHGLTLPGMLACLFAEAILYMRWRRALRDRSLEINTIMNYQNHDIF